MKDQKAKKKGRRILRGVLMGVAGIILFCLVAGIIGYLRSAGKAGRTYLYTDQVRLIEDTQEQGIGDVQVRTLPVEGNLAVQRASYTFSGRVVVAYRDGKDSVFVTMNDDGTDVLELYRGSVRSQRLLSYWDNTRILLGDYVLECPEGYTLDTCPEDAATMVPISFPEEFVKDPNVVDKWTEVIVSPDNEHIAWTIRRKDCGAVNAMGKLVRREGGYVIEDACFLSNMNPFTKDLENDGMSLYTPVIGGEVKQFVQGGRAISLVGAASNGMADSVVQDISTGEVALLTCTPGYDETTILSPDEKLGIVMTTRFSPTTDMAVLGVLPRPFGEVTHVILGQVYMYGVTGVRSGREGNIGPALVNLERSARQVDYQGLNLSDPEGGRECFRYGDHSEGYEAFG